MSVIAVGGKAPAVPGSVFVADGARLIGDVVLGDEASVWFNSVLRADINRITVGARTNIQDGSIFHVTAANPVVVGNGVTVGHRAIVHGCRIGNDSLIGMGAVVLDNARIGSGVLVAAGAVVLENAVVPDGVLVAGVPARVLRNLTDEEKLGIRESADHYVEYARSYRS